MWKMLGGRSLHRKGAGVLLLLFFFFCSSLAVNADMINWEEDGDVNAREQQHLVPLFIGLAPRTHRRN